MIENAHIIAVGDEVLWGETVNTNAAWMANFLRSFGVRPTYHCVVPDQERIIGQAVTQALRMADLAVVIGGLGPTADDRTLDGVSQALKRPLSVNAALLSHISARHSRAAGWRESAERQARALEGSELWLNPRGQAPGQVIQGPDGYVVLLPGPPREMQGICEKWMAGWLAGRSAGPIQRDTYSIFDMGESAVATHLWPLLQGAYPQMGIYAQPGRIDVRVETPATLMGAIMRQRGRAWVLNRIPVPVYELGQSSREAYLVHWLTDQGRRLAAMESLTGGLLLSSLIAVPGASHAIAGGLVAYDDKAKADYGVPLEVLSQFGAVSEESALAMARAVRHQFNADIGVATTGFAGPDGGTPQNPRGTFFVAAVAEQGQIVRRRYVPLERQAVRQIATRSAVSAIWQLLQLPLAVSEQKPHETKELS